jgi:hypothetical protein
MKKFVVMLYLLMFASSLFAASGPKVTLQTASLGYPYAQSFTVNVTFSEPVTGMGHGVVNVTNAYVNSVIGSKSNYVMVLTPITPGPVSVFIPGNSVKSLITGELNQASNKLNITALDPALQPSSNFDLSNWSLVIPLPLGGIGEATSISNTTLNGIPAINSGYSNPPYFFTGLFGSMNFFAPLNGATTPGSVFPRTELIEMLPGLSPTWKLSTFTSNTLTASLLVSEVPPSKRIVIGKIQDKGNPDDTDQVVAKKSLVKLYYDLNLLDPNNNPCNGCVYARIRPVPAQDFFLKTVTLINNIPLNKLFMFKFTLLGDGTLTIKANNVSTKVLLNTSTDNTIGWGSQELYFRVGVYVPENGSSNVQGGADSFYSLEVKHVAPCQ